MLVDFWAPGCAPCQAISAMMETLAVAYVKRVRIIKVNIDESTAVAERYDIQFIPTIALFDNGMMIARYVGPAPRATLESILDSALAHRANVATVATADRSVVGTRKPSRLGVFSVFALDQAIACARKLPHVSLRGVMVLLRRLAQAWRNRSASG